MSDHKSSVLQDMIRKNIMRELDAGRQIKINFTFELSPELIKKKLADHVDKYKRKYESG